MQPGKDKETNDDKVRSAEKSENQDNENVAGALSSAEKDIANDPEMNLNDRNDDLDEGEAARAGGDKNDLA